MTTIPREALESAQAYQPMIQLDRYPCGCLVSKGCTCDYEDDAVLEGDNCEQD